MMDESVRIRTMLDKVVEALKSSYHPERVILFGSWAYGVPTAESDVDVLIVKDTDQPFHRRWADVYRLVQPLVKGVDFSPFVMTPAEVAQRQRARDPILEEILTRGETLYAG
jgi:predicted nucleotidyltransferase